MTLEMTRDYRLRWMDFDQYGRMQPTAILDIFQDMAILHAEEIGIGRDSMVAQGVFWAVVRSKMEIVHDPKHFQVINVRTWPHSLSRFSFIRDFEMTDEQGEVLVKASQEWVLMDIQTRKFCSAKDFYHGPTDFCEDRMFEKRIRKAPDFDEGNRPTCIITPSYTDIDLNGHVNNAMYANFAVNALNPGSEGAVKTLQIDYRHEALPGQPLVVHTLVEETRVLSKGVTEDGTISFVCALELR